MRVYQMMMQCLVMGILCFIITDTATFSQVTIANAKCGGATFFIHKNDTLQFDTPNLMRNISNIPNDIWQIAKSPLHGKNWIGLSVVTAGTVLLIDHDAEILHWVRNTSDGIGLKPETNYNIVLKAGDTKILKLPKNLNTFFYQVGEGGTSMVLATGLWAYGKLSNNQRAISTANDLTETFIAMGVTTQILKRATGRESPFTASVPGGKWTAFPSYSHYQGNTSAYDAFPSGHLATLMATVTVLSYNYPEKRWIKPLGYTIMGLSAWAMMNTGSALGR